MKSRECCPKCAGTKILKIKGKRFSSTSAIPVSTTLWDARQVALDRYICFGCGYTEEYIQLDDGVLKWAAKAFKKQRDEDGFV